MTDDQDKFRRQLNRHVYDLAVSFTHGEAHGPGLYVQLQQALGRPARQPGSDDSGHPKPTSRPPLSLDVSDQIAVIDRTVHSWLFGWVSTRRPQSTVAGLRRVPDLIPSPMLGYVVNEMGKWNAHAQVALGYKVPSVAITGSRCGKRVLTMAGWRSQGCDQVTLRSPAQVDPGSSASVWCSNPACHDSLSFPDCEKAADGSWLCRSSDRDLTHAIRWAAAEFGGMALLQQQRAEQERDGGTAA